jgi:hypothetical protein
LCFEKYRDSFTENGSASVLSGGRSLMLCHPIFHRRQKRLPRRVIGKGGGRDWYDIDLDGI